MSLRQRYTVIAFAWLLVVAGLTLVVTSFFIAATRPVISPWPSLVVGFCLTILGIMLMAIGREERRAERDNDLDAVTRF